MLLSNLDLLATAPGGVARLRELILTLAVQGKLVPQDPADEPASVLLQKIRAEKDRLIAEGKSKRDKPVAEIAEEEKPFEVPQGWEWVRCVDYFVELCTGPFGSVIHQEDYVTNGVPLINPSHMVDGRIVHDPLITLNESDAERLSPYVLTAGDIVLARRGEVGRYALVTERENGWLCGTGSFFVRLIPDCDRSYLALIFRDNRFRRHLQGESVGTTMTNLNQRILLEALIAVPPLAEQSRIVTRVEELMRLCDALEAKGRLEAVQHTQLVSTLLGTLTASATSEELAENWQRVAQHFNLLLDRPQAIDALEQTLLQLAVRGLLVPQDPADEPASVLLQKIRAEKDHLIATGQIKRDKPLPPITDEEKPFELPVGWGWVRLGAVVNASEAGWSPTCIGSPRRPGHWGVLKVSAVSWGEFDAAANKELPSELSPKPEYEVKDGDFLLSRANTAELVARSVVVGAAEPKLMLSDKIIRLDVSSQMNRVFLNLVNNANHSREHYAANASGTSSSMKNVSREVVLVLPVPLPPLPEQSRIVTRVTALRRLCADLRQRLVSASTQQASLAEVLVQGAVQS